MTSHLFFFILSCGVYKINIKIILIIINKHCIANVRITNNRRILQTRLKITI